MKAGDLDRRIIVQRVEVTYNALNEGIETWSKLAALSASREDVSDGEKLAAGQLGSFVRSRFVVRHTPTSATITPVDRIVHEGGIWSIHGVKEAKGGRRRFIEITAVRDADVEAEEAS